MSQPSRQETWQAAFDNLFEQGAESFRRYADSLCSKKPIMASPEDLLIHARNKVHRAFPKLFPITQDSFNTYMHLAIKRRHYDLLKRHRRHADVVTSQSPDTEEAGEWLPAANIAQRLQRSSSWMAKRLVPYQHLAKQERTYLIYPPSVFAALKAESDSAPRKEKTTNYGRLTATDIAQQLGIPFNWVSRHIVQYAHHATVDSHGHTTYPSWVRDALKAEREHVQPWAKVEQLKKMLGVPDHLLSISEVADKLGTSALTHLRFRLREHGQLVHVFTKKSAIFHFYEPEVVEKLRPEFEDMKERAENPQYFWEDENYDKVLLHRLRYLAQQLGRKALTRRDLREHWNVPGGPTYEALRQYWPNLKAARTAAGLTKSK